MPLHLIDALLQSRTGADQVKTGGYTPPFSSRRRRVTSPWWIYTSAHHSIPRADVDKATASDGSTPHNSSRCRRATSPWRQGSSQPAPSSFS